MVPNTPHRPETQEDQLNFKPLWPSRSSLNNRPIVIIDYSAGSGVFRTFLRTSFQRLVSHNEELVIQECWTTTTILDEAESDIP